jgi:hypothetical protein
MLLQNQLPGRLGRLTIVFTAMGSVAHCEPPRFAGE